jgi:hypothetical protein
MSLKEIIDACRREYGLSSKVKIRNLNLDGRTFDIMLGECLVTLPFPKGVSRFLILEKIIPDND